MNNTRNVTHHHHTRGHSFNGFANIRPFSYTISSQGKPGKLSFESAKLATIGIDDLLSSTEGGKHDYDWLLTPPETPHLPSSEGLSQPTLVPPRSSLGRPMSYSHASTLSASQSENNNTHSHSRPARSGSVTRSPNRSSSIHNTRPSSPITRSPSAARSSTPTSRQTTTPTPPRALLPRSFPSSTTDTNKTRTSQVSRPSTPSSTPRPSIPANLHSPSATSRSPSRPSTPSRRHSLPSPLPSATRVARSSATPRPQLIVPPDFSLETPPNLRTTLPSDRPVSAGRSRPGAVATLPLKPNSEMQTPVVTVSRRQPSPIANRGRLSEYTSKTRVHGNAGDASELVARKSVKSSTTASDNNGLGRTISKKSLDMAIRHMDVRNGSGTLRSLSSATLYPQSVRTSTPKTHHTRGLSVASSMNINGSLQSRNNGNNTNRKNGREKGERQKQYLGKLNAVVDVYPYDSVLLKEDLNNTNWLHSVDGKCDEGAIFDNGFELENEHQFNYRDISPPESLQEGDQTLAAETIPELGIDKVQEPKIVVDYDDSQLRSSIKERREFNSISGNSISDDLKRGSPMASDGTSDSDTDSGSTSDSGSEREREERRKRRERILAEKAAVKAINAIKERENMVAKLEGEKESLEKILEERAKEQAQEASQLQSTTMETMDAVELEKQKHNNTRMEFLARLAKLETANADLSRSLAAVQWNLEIEVKQVAELRQQISSKELLHEELRRRMKNPSQTGASQNQLASKGVEFEREILEAEHSSINDKVTQLEEKARKLEADIEITRKEMEEPTEVEVELKQRLQQMTDHLIQKQAKVESLSSEKASLVFRIEAVSRLLDENTSASGATNMNPASSSSDLESGLWELSNSKLKPMLKARIHSGKRQLGSLLQQLDYIFVTGALFLKRNTTAKWWALIYLVCLHLWVLYILLSHSSPANEGRSGAQISLENINNTGGV